VSGLRRRWVALAVLMFSLPALASAASDRPPVRGFDELLATGTVAAGLDFVGPRALPAASPAQLSTWGLRGLTAIDPALSIERSKDAATLVLRRGAARLAQIPAPPEGDARAWATTVGRLTHAAWDGSDAARLAGTGGIIKAYFDAMLGALDPYSHYTPPHEAQAERLRRGGRAGVGIAVRLRRDTFVVGEVEAGGPAAQAGIRAGDRLLAVDGQPVQGAALEAVEALLAGPDGTKASVSVQRRATTRTVVLARSRTVTETVASRRDGAVTVIRITGFNRATAARFAQALVALRGAAPRQTGVIIDIRGNRGGSLQQAVASVAMLQPRGVVVTTIGRHPEAAQIARADGRDLLEGLPVVVLVDRGTASAAEIFAAALADHRRAVVVGSVSQGKGLVQTLGYLPDGGEVVLSWSQMLAPLGWSLESLGVLPQLCTSFGPAETDRELARLAGGQSPLDAALRRARAAGTSPSPLLTSETRAACPPRDGGDSDLTAAHALLAAPAAYSAALLGVSVTSGIRMVAPQGLTARAAVSD